MTDRNHWTPMTSEQLRQLRHDPVIVAKITELAHRLCDNANAIARDARASEVHKTNKAQRKAQADSFAVVVQNHTSTQRPRAYVRPVGKTGLRVEMGESVLFKAIATMGGQADHSAGPKHPRSSGAPHDKAISVDLGDDTPAS